MNKLKQLIKNNNLKKDSEIKIQIVVYKSTIDRAKDFLNKLESKKINPIEKAKRMFRILESLHK